MDYENLLQFAINDMERERIEAVMAYGSNRKAAEYLGINRRSMDRYMDGLLQRAHDRGYSPEYGVLQQVPPGYHVRGVSTLVDNDGEIKMQWVKSNKNAEDLLAAVRTAIDTMSEDIRPEKRVKLRKNAKYIQNLLNVYIITDYHIGMKSWGEETGADWDTQIAEDLLVDWFKYAIQHSPASHTAILAQLGDFLHFDSLEAVTPTSGHILDADTRFRRVIQVAVRVLRRIVRMLLKKHQLVHIIMAEGNHDLASSGWLTLVLQQLYEDEPRVVVDMNPDPYYCYEFGSNSLFFHHGHKKTPKNIDDVLVAKFREEYGRTKHSFCHMGHYHHNLLVEGNLMQVEQHRTLAAPDAYASSNGYMSGRDAKVITYDREHGEVLRNVISPELARSGGIAGL